MNFKVLAVALALGAVIATVSAECPNACSGHGDCQSFRDFCQCYKGFQGNDCSQRTCAFGLSFIDTPQGDLNHDNAMNGGFYNRLANTFQRPKGTGNLTALNPMWRPDGWWESHPSQLYGTHGQSADFPMRQQAQEGHFYAECSNRGLCDRASGECVCFTGYEGTACNRTVCANSCSGHGTCESIREQIPSSDSTVNDYMLWDADKTYGCVCDPEYFGNDCSKRRCYRNDDPLTSTTTTKWLSEKLSEQGETQIVKVQCANQGAVVAGSTIKLTYTDVQFGEAYETAAITVTTADDATAASALKSALEALPNQILASHTDNTKITSVTRDTQTTVLGGTVYRYFVNFNSRLGNVPTMTVDSTGVTCKAGIVLPANYKSDDWNENIEVQLTGNGPTADTTVQLRIANNNTAPGIHQYQYKVFSDGNSETAASAEWSDPVMFPDSASAFVPLARVHESSTLSAFGDYQLPAKFKFTLGPEVENTASRRSAVDPDAAHSATETYEIQFKAPAADVSVFTQLHNISDTLPIAYALDSRPVAARTNFVRETLYVEYTSPFQTHWVSENFTITGASVTTYNWAASWSGNSKNGATHADGWNFLEDAADSDKYLIFKFEHGDDTPAVRGTDFGKWAVSAYPGYVSSSGGDNDEILFLMWSDSTRPIEELKFDISITNGGTWGNSSRYVWSLNGVNMGEYSVSANFQTLGGVDSSHEAAKVQVRWMHEAFGLDRHNPGEDYRNWRFNMVKNPVQNNWAYDETLRVHYHSTDNGAQETPTKNLIIIINMVTTAGNPDTYRWKLSDDEVWYGDSTGTGSAISEDPFELADVSTHTNSAAELAKYRFWLSGGADATGLSGDPSRSCTDNVNARYYVQLGAEGVNDFATCSDRGICDEDTGECKCFKGYAGQDCSEQHALSL